MIFEGDAKLSLSMLGSCSVDAFVTDPPYGLSKEPNIEEVLKNWADDKPYSHKSSGFMGKKWDSFVPNPDLWREVYRVLRPGGYCLAFAGSRTQGLMAKSLETRWFYYCWAVELGLHFWFSNFKERRNLDRQRKGFVGKSRQELQIKR
jgi:site-specific DNA-methyltransferase (adenine-specific)